MQTKITITCDGQTLDAIGEATKKYLSRPDWTGKAWFKTWTGKAWFKTEKDAEEWMGDVFYDAVEYYMEKLGITIYSIAEEE